MATRRTTRDPPPRRVPSTDRTPKGVHPEAWRLRDALVLARDRLPWATAEARLLDGLRLWIQLECTTGGACGRSLPTSGPRWAACLDAVAAVAGLCSSETKLLLAPWVAASGRGGAPAPVSGVAFVPMGG